MPYKLPNESTMREIAERVFVSYSAVVKWRKDYKGGDNPFPAPTGKKWGDHSDKPSYTFDNEQFDQWHNKWSERKAFKKTCSVNACLRTTYSKELCEKHHARYKKHGDPHYLPKRFESCNVKGCDNMEAGSTEYCTTHYRRYKKTGNPLKTEYNHVYTISASADEFLKQRFVKKDNGCWDWTGNCYADGYGAGTMRFGQGRAHRLAYQTWVGEIKPSMQIHHKCSNIICVNPDHLQQTTQAENTAEMLERAGYKRTIKKLEGRIKQLEKQNG